MASDFLPCAVLALLILGFAGPEGHTAERFRLQKGPDGRIAAFAVEQLPLADFVREYSRVTGTPVAAEGDWDQWLKGSVTLLLRQPQSCGELTELFHRVLSDNGFAALDAPAGNGWVVTRARDARDLALPVYEVSEVPETSRLVTAVQTLKYGNAEMVARIMRSFMPAYSRIIPATRTEVFITDTGVNIRKLRTLIARMDTADLGQGHEPLWFNPAPQSCGEHHIEKLVVEKLEIGGSQEGGAPPPLPGLAPRPRPEGAKK